MVETEGKIFVPWNTLKDLACEKNIHTQAHISNRKAKRKEKRKNSNGRKVERHSFAFSRRLLVLFLTPNEQ